jgi:hypothetical protein
MSDDRISLSAQVIGLEEQRNNFKKKCQELENTIQTRNETISKLKMALQIEKFKSRLFSQIITQQTNLKIGDIYQENEEGIHIHNFPDGTIPVIVHDLLESKQYAISNRKKVEKQPGKSFRTVKNRVELVEENPEEQEQKIKQAEEAISSIVQENNLDVSYKETVEFIENMFEEVVKTRVYKKSLTNMKEYRGKLLGRLDLASYTKLVKTHIARLETIFAKKKYDEKKTMTTVCLSLSPLEQRLLSYGQYYNSELEPDEMQRLKLCLKVNMDFPKRYVPFVQSELCIKVCNYSLCISTIKDTMKKILVNPYGFANLVYLHLEKSSPEDRYSFYSLEKIDPDGKRCWKMECRLEEFGKFISEHIRNYCIKLFRKIYYDIFSDNIYREDYTEKAPAAQQDCEQLLVNIISLSKPRAFCNVLRSIVAKYSTIQPSKIDKFNFTRDDPISKRSFAQEDDDDKDLTPIVQRLFDEISSENAMTIWQSRNQ